MSEGMIMRRGKPDKSKGLTATAKDIISGKTALVNGSILEGSLEAGYKIKIGEALASSGELSISSDGEFNIEGFWVERNAWPIVKAYGDDNKSVELSYLHCDQFKVNLSVLCLPVSNPYARVQTADTSSCSIDGATAKVSASNIPSGSSWFYICWGR